MASDLISVIEAAERLRVSRRRVEALILSGALPAERVGARWILSASNVRNAEHNLWREAGRPMSQKTAWRFIQLQLGTGPFNRASLDRLRRRLRSRATHIRTYVHPSQLRHIEHSPGVILGGWRAAMFTGAPIDPTDKADIYVRRSDADALSDRLRARRTFEGANLIFHVIEDDVWPFESQQKHADAWTAWLDLADAEDRAADPLLDRLVGGRVRD